MKKVIKLLNEAYHALAINHDDAEALAYIDKAIAELKNPHWETPEQYRKRTGEKWLDTSPVYWRWAKGDKSWNCGFYQDAKAPPLIPLGVAISGRVIVCATEAGPPPKTWKPEETQ